ncbi:MAG: hypothetical protein HDQ96_05185 [Lachnospiraceae bacterium]|nr:hypothetical protein [Lachnospiraceae bacterium]
MRESNISKIKIIVSLLFCLTMTGCAYIVDAGERTGSDALNETGQSIGWIKSKESTGENESFAEEEHHLIPMECQWEDGDRDYDPNDTIYYKTFYDDFARGWIRHIEYPNIDIKEELGDYFLFEDDFEKWDNLVEMFFDYRTIEMSEEELKALFYQRGYELSLQSAEMEELHVRFVEITEIGGLSLYPTRAIIQTWNEDYIYLQNITSPIPRKIMSFLVVDDREAYRLVVHSSGVSRDYVMEEELSFWEYQETYWALVPMELEIDTSHAHIAGENSFLDMDRDELFETSYYRDGIAYRPSRQNDGVNSYTVRLGKMEEIEKNKIFRLLVVSDYQETGAYEDSSHYIEFEIKQE